MKFYEAEGIKERNCDRDIDLVSVSDCTSVTIHVQMSFSLVMLYRKFSGEG